jgi:hypothetical protein
VNASTCIGLTTSGPVNVSASAISVGGQDASSINLTAHTVRVDATSFAWGEHQVRTMGDKITSDDFSDEVFIFNCGSASTVL